MQWKSNSTVPEASENAFLPLGDVVALSMCFCRTVAEVVSGVLQDFRPDLVLYDAGVDPHADDKLGRLKLTDNGLMRREMQVLENKNRNSQPADIWPLV